MGEVGEVKEDVDDKQCSLEKEEEEEETKATDNGELGENVITGSGEEAGGQSSGEEDLVKEESCREEKQAGALGLRRELESGDEKEEEEVKGESESTGVD